MEKQKIVRVYDDDGVSKICLPHVLHMFRRYHVQTIDANGIICGEWMENSDILCFPGGAASPYAKKLNGIGNENIKSFVRGGGAYLGICAGAYYGTQRIEFDKNGPLEIIYDNELDFLKGTAIGPAFGKFDYRTYRHVTHSRAIALIGGQKKRINLMFYGGPHFPEIGSENNVKILALCSETGFPSIISGKYGSGPFVLSGVHISTDETLFNRETNKYLQQLAPVLAETASERMELICNIFQILQSK